MREIDAAPDNAYDAYMPFFFFKVSRHFSFTLEVIVCFYNPPGLTLLSLESSANCSPCVISFEPSDSGNQVCFEWLQ